VNNETIEKLQQEIFGLMRESVSDLWFEEDQEFLKQLSLDVAREKVLSITSDHPEKHQINLMHLAAMVNGVIATRGLKIRRFKRAYFIKALEIIIKTIAVPLLKASVEKKAS